MRYTDGEMRDNKKNKVKLVPKIFGLLIFAIIVIVFYNIFLIVLSSKDKEQDYIFGMKAYVIETDSMEPELKVGDVIIIKKCERQDLKVGDIITFENRGELITHRITEFNPATLRYATKGDKNSLNDIEAVKFQEIKGKMFFKLPMFWKIIQKLQNTMYIVILLVIVFTVFLHSRRITRKSKIRRRKKKIEDKRIRDEENRQDS